MRNLQASDFNLIGYSRTQNNNHAFMVVIDGFSNPLTFYYSCYYREFLGIEQSWWQTPNFGHVWPNEDEKHNETSARWLFSQTVLNHTFLGRHWDDKDWSKPLYTNRVNSIFITPLKEHGSFSVAPVGNRNRTFVSQEYIWITPHQRLFLVKKELNKRTKQLQVAHKDLISRSAKILEYKKQLGLISKACQVGE